MTLNTSEKLQVAGIEKPVHSALDTTAIKADFPILDQQVHNHRLVYLDSAASSHKPKLVTDALTEFYHNNNSNIHRGLHTLAERATTAYEKTRSHVAKFISASKPEEVIFTRSATESINLIAYTWGEQNICEGDEILFTELEHHANLVPWIMLAKRKNAVIKRIPLTSSGELDLSNLDELLTSKTKLVAVSHMSNVLGTILPVKELAAKAHEFGAVIVVDGAQAAPHMPVDVIKLDLDFYAFSSHKMLGPTGVGVLYGKRQLLEDMPPFNFGGEMISEVTFENATWSDLPNKFEAGTPNIAGVIAFDAALTYLEKLGMERIREHEMTLTAYALEKLLQIDGLEIQGPRQVSNRGGAISFSFTNIHPHDISTYLDSRGIAVRAGHHCAQPLMRVLGKMATTRASIYIYNDEQDIDALCEALNEMKKYFGI